MGRILRKVEKKIKSEKKEEVLTFFQKFKNYVSKNLKIIVSILCSLLFVVAIYFSVSSYRYFREKKALSELSGLNLYAIDEMSKGKLKSIRKKLKSFIESYGDTKAAILPLCIYAKLSFLEGDLKEAKFSYKELIERLKEPYRSFAKYALANIYEQEGKYKPALLIYEELSKKTFLKKLSLLGEARIYYLLGEKEKKKRVLSKISKLFPELKNSYILESLSYSFTKLQRR